MDLYKITIGSKKKFYESKRTFDLFWNYHNKWSSRWHDVVAYQLDYKKKEWKEIRRVKFSK